LNRKGAGGLHSFGILRKLEEAIENPSDPFGILRDTYESEGILKNRLESLGILRKRIPRMLRTFGIVGIQGI